MPKHTLRHIFLKLASLFYSNFESKVLFYHDIHCGKRYCEYSTPIELFKIHIDTIRNANFEIVKKITSKYGQIVIQFDDGYKGILDCLPYIETEQIPVEIFVITNRIGGENYLSQSDIERMLSTGLVKFSSHTHTHLKLNQYDSTTVTNEIKTSIEILKTITKTNIDSICFPYGYFSSSVIDCCDAQGINHQYSSLPGSYHNFFMNKVIRRNLVQFASKRELIWALKGAHSIFNERYINQHFKK